jgi:alpha/beta hydrolase fold
MSNFTRKILPKLIGIYINLLSYTLPNKAVVLAYKYFSQPRGGKLFSENLPKILKGAIAETIVLDPHHFQTYTWRGNDTKILLIHGWESNAARWEKLILFLKKSGNTIIAIDAPAHGLSSGKEFDIPTYASFIHAISEIHKPKFIVAHSMGGMATFYYQYFYKPKYLQKMILLGTPADFNEVVNNFINTLGLHSKVYDLLCNYIKQRFDIVIDEFSGVNFLKNTTITGLIAHDLEDKAIHFNEGKKLAATWKTAQFIQTKGLGHSLQDDTLYLNIYNFLYKK